MVGAVDRQLLGRKSERPPTSGHRSLALQASPWPKRRRERCGWRAGAGTRPPPQRSSTAGLRSTPASRTFVPPRALPPRSLCGSLLVADAPCWCSQCQGTALYFAALNNHLEVVALLLERNADVNVANKSGQTPLHVAQSEEVAQALLDAECEDGSMAADTSLRNRWGKTAEEYNSMLGRVGFKGIEGREAVATKITAVLDARHEAQWAGAEGEAEEEAPA